MPSVKYRFGEVEADETLPPIKAIEQGLSGLGGPTDSACGVPLNTNEDYYFVGDDYIFIKFVKVVTEEQPVVEDGEITIDENHPARTMQFLLTREGDYVFESTQGVYDEDVLEHLIGEKPFEIDFTCRRYNRFTAEQMLSFYNSAFRIRGLKIADVAEIENDGDIDDDVSRYVERAGENLIWAEFSTGNEDNNLKASSIVDGFARRSEIKNVRLKDSEGQIQKVNRNGRYSFSYPADLDLSGLAERTRNLVGVFTDGMIREDD